MTDLTELQAAIAAMEAAPDVLAHGAACIKAEEAMALVAGRIFTAYRERLLAEGHPEIAARLAPTIEDAVRRQVVDVMLGPDAEDLIP